MLSGISTMVVFRSLVLSALLLVLLPTVATAAKCDKDACLRVVQRGKRPGGVGGCGAFFAQTVVPVAVTTTVENTQVETTTSTIDSTTSTTTDSTTTTTLTSTSTSVLLTSTTTTTTTTTTSTTFSPPAIKKRTSMAQPITTSRTAVPPYAKQQCTNTSQYSSACSCIGAKHTTITAPTPTVTSTRTITTTESDSTTTVISTDVSTSILTSTELSITTTTTTSTDLSTSISITTTTTTAAPPKPTFYLQVSSGDLQGYYGYGNPDVAPSGSFGYVPVMLGANQVSDYGTFYLDDINRLVIAGTGPGAGLLAGGYSGSYSLVSFVTLSTFNIGYSPLFCTRSGVADISCKTRSSTVSQFYYVLKNDTRYLGIGTAAQAAAQGQGLVSLQAFNI